MVSQSMGILSEKIWDRIEVLEGIFPENSTNIDLENDVFCERKLIDKHPELEYFWKILRKIKQIYWNFTLTFKESGSFAKIFEISNTAGVIMIIKLPYMEHIHEKEFDITQIIQKEIELHQKFFQYNQELKNNKKTASLSKNIKIPMIHIATNEWKNIIIMEKIPWRTVWFHAIVSIFSPIFSSPVFLEKIKKENRTDEEIEKFLYLIENHLWKKEIFNPGILEDDPNVTVKEILGELAQADFPSELFVQIFPWEERWKTLKKTYEFFLKEFKNAGLVHPDPHMRNFIITNQNELWVIDFW